MQNSLSPQIHENLHDTLRSHGLRPTKQRIALAQMIFGQGHRHITAEELHNEAREAGLPLSLATVYNNLHSFHQAGLLRIIVGEDSKRWFDTDLDDHHHFYIEETQKIVDAPYQNGAPVVDNLPSPPEGMEIAQVDLMIKLRRKTDSSASTTPSSDQEN